MTTSPMSADRQRRIDAIRAAARVRRLLGQGALYTQLLDGRHEIVFNGRRVAGETLEQTIEEARVGSQQP